MRGSNLLISRKGLTWIADWVDGQGRPSTNSSVAAEEDQFLDFVLRVGGEPFLVKPVGVKEALRYLPKVDTVRACWTVPDAGGFVDRG